MLEIDCGRPPSFVKTGSEASLPQVVDPGTGRGGADSGVDESLFEVEGHALGVEEGEQHARARSIAGQRILERLRSQWEEVRLVSIGPLLHPLYLDEQIRQFSRQ